jgi:hypothetical protein
MAAPITHAAKPLPIKTTRSALVKPASAGFPAIWVILGPAYFMP